MATTKWYVLPSESYTTDDGSTGYRPAYMDRSDVSGYSGGWVPAPGSFPGSSNPQGNIYVGAVEAEQSAHDAARAASDVWLIGTGTDADVSPTQAADYLNGQFRPQSFADAVAKVEAETGITVPTDRDSLDDWAARFTTLDPGTVRDLTPQEWAERLGQTGFE